jgi:GntR family transcriptional regulator, transcriptional repressor for pyruvate dehydrogenase complex
VILGVVTSPVASSPAARKASEVIAEQIRAEIATGRLQPGEVLPSETVLLERYDVARSTMREALRILESDGLVLIQRGTKGGARVQAPNVAALARRVGLHLQLRGAQLRDLIEVQVVLQPWAAGLAALARTDEDLASLRRAVELVESSDTVAEYLAGFTALVRALHDATHNPVIALFSELTGELWRDGITAFAEEIDAPARYSKDFFAASAATYGRLVDLIEQGESAAAQSFWQQYMEDTGAARHAERAPLHVYEAERRGR